jgi:hypothetical protein
MPWFKVDDDFAFHQKAVAAGNAAIGLWTRAGAWSSQTLTDGYVPVHMIASLGNISQANRLVEVGLWDKTAGGYRFHQWDDRQPSREETEAKRAAARERMRAARRAKSARSSEVVRANSERTFARTDDEHVEKFTRSSPNPVPSRPDPSRPVPFNGGYVGWEGHVRNAAGDPPRCFKHRDDPNPPACGQCAEARKRHEENEAERIAAERAAKGRRRLAIDSCEWCDDNGIRHEPGEVRDLDLPAIRCTHEPMALDEWHKLAPIEVEANA